MLCMLIGKDGRMGKHLKQRLKIWLLCALVVLLAGQAAGPVYAWDKDDGSDNIENGTITAIGDTTIKVKKSGDVVITMTAKTATNSWRWRTVGYYLTKNKVDINESALTGKAGPGVRASQVIWLDHNTCKVKNCPFYGRRDGERSDKSNGGITTTTITLTKGCIDAHRQISGISLDGGKSTNLYLQGVLAFYYGSEYRNGVYYSVDQARAANRSKGNGRDWSFFPRSSGEGWVKRYNIPLYFTPDETPVAVSYYRKNTKAQKAAGATTTWTQMKTINSNDSRWTSKTSSQGSIANGNGLGFDTAEFYEGDRIHHTSLSAPQALSQVLSGEEYDGYYVYRLSWSVKDAAVSSTSGSKKQKNSNLFTGHILNSDGKLTADYKAWYKDARKQKFSCPSAEKGLILNVYYKRAIVPKPDKEDVTDHMVPAAEATIQSDPRGADTKIDVETYDSTEGIPSSEPQYINVYSKNYLYTVGYTTKSDSKTYHYHEGCYYVSTETGGYWVHGYGSMTITCTWEDVTTLGIWKIDHSDVTNKSLPDRTERLYPHDYTVNPPDVVYNGKVVQWSPYGTAPCGAAGAPDPSQSYCKSGKLHFNGKVVLNDAVRSLKGDTHAEFPAPTVIGNDVLYENGYIIPPALANNEYASTGKITYQSIVNTNTSYSDTLDFKISKINDVTVHTPTVSYVSVPMDAKRYCQLVSPSSNAQLVLDQYFRVCNSSYGFHSDLRGYGTRNYTRNANQFIAKKEVRFPFDAYICTSNGSIGTFYPAGTWITLDLITGENTFYLPVWVNEGNYTVTFRSRAINCDANVGTEESQLEAVTEATANTDLSNYLSTASINVEVSGRLFGMTMYDISDYPAWGTRVFRQPSSTQLTGLRYTVGLNNRNGSPYRPTESSKYTFALVDGSHPYLKNYGVLKPGYVERFYVTTFGDMNFGDDYIDIRPTFYYVKGSGAAQTRQRVDLYYDETINGKYEHFVKVGSALDKKNVKSMSIGDLYASVPDEELHKKAELAGSTVAQLRAETGARYRYDRIVVPLASATFVGEKYVPDSGIPNEVDSDMVSQAAQKWYFEYSLPASVHAVPIGTAVTAGKDTLSVDDYAARYGIDYTEDFWCSGGYLVVNWSIKTVSSRFNSAGGGGEDDPIIIDGGSPSYHLDYINAGNWAQGFCNMWNLEGYQYTKTDSAGKTYAFTDGDLLMFYTSGGGGNDTPSPSVRNDYRAYGTH